MACTPSFKIARFPYGPCGVAPILTVTLGWIFMIVGCISCNIFKICSGDECLVTFDYNSYNTDDLRRQLGISVDSYYDPFWGGTTYTYTYDYDPYPYNTYDTYDTYGNTDDVSYDDGSGCRSIPSSWKDGYLKAGFAISVLGTIFGSFAFLASLCTMFLKAPRKFWLGVSILCFVLAPFSGLEGSIGLASESCMSDVSEFGHDIKCKPSLGAILAYVAFFLWIGAGVSFLLLDNYERELPHEKVHPELEVKSATATHVPQGEGSISTTADHVEIVPPHHCHLIKQGRLVERESVVQHDGTVVVTSTETFPDGSKTTTRETQKGDYKIGDVVLGKKSTETKTAMNCKTTGPKDKDKDKDKDCEDTTSDDNKTVVEIDTKVKSKEDGSKVTKTLETYTHRDKRTSSVKTVVLSKELENGKMKRKTTIIRTDVNGEKSKTSNTEVLDAWFSA